VADVSLVSFRDRPVLAANSPGKFYDSLATGTPVVVTNPGWTKRFVQTHNCGWYVPPEAPDALASRLRRLLNTPKRLRETSQNARRVARQHFDRTEIMDRYADLIARVERKIISNS
jgi:glycosyltransferase involved in cell wall biosynthesis